MQKSSAVYGLRYAILPVNDCRGEARLREDVQGVDVEENDPHQPKVFR